MFHLRVKIIGRGGGRSAAGASAYRTGGRNGAAAMAYRAGTKLRDARTGRTFDYSRKAAIDDDGFGILHTEILLPVGAPDWMKDRQKLIDAIEERETRPDAQLLREVEISLPRELTFDQQRDLIRDFVQVQFVARGMVADIAIHDEEASDGQRNPHAHVLLTLRSVTAEGFGNKERRWNARELVTEWREAWADMTNERLAEYGHERRIDHRSHHERDIQLKPDTYIGPRAGRQFDGLLHAERQECRKARRQRNVEAIAEDPRRLIDMVAREKATFTRADLAYALRRATGLTTNDSDCETLLDAATTSPDLVPVAADDRGPTRFATREMVQCEFEMAKAANAMAHRDTLDVTAPPKAGLTIEQTQAYLHATQGPDLVAISGVAGAGKTRLLASVARAFQASGYRVRGAALAGIAAKGLSTEAGIPSRTLASTLHGWNRTDETGAPDPIAPLEQGDVLIVDEAGMIGSSDMRRLLVEADRAKAKVILVGDAQQLQAIDAGAAFRSIVDTHGAAELQQVHRQAEEWQREASTLFAQQSAAKALALYDKAGALHSAPSTRDAMDELVASYMETRDRRGDQLILAHSRADVAVLNDKVREALREKGHLGPDVAVTIREQVRDEFGEVEVCARRIRLAQGDRVLFTKNDTELGVQNGSTGTILELEQDGRLAIELANGDQVEFSAKDYSHLALGYAMTVHKAQGATVDRTFMLASRSLDAHVGYVGMTRHRESATLFYGADQFEEKGDLLQTFSRQRPKDSTLDYLVYREPERAEEKTRGSGDSERKAPLSAAERIRQNVAARRSSLSRDRGRDRSYGD